MSLLTGKIIYSRFKHINEILKKGIDFFLAKKYIFLPNIVVRSSPIHLELIFFLWVYNSKNIFLRFNKLHF